MFFLFGEGSEFEDKENGKRVKGKCPNCKNETLFVEQIKKEYIHLFFIPILSSEDKNAPKNIYRCQRCQNCYTLNTEKPKNPIDEAKKQMDEKKKREDEKKQRDKKIEQDLLDLKKRLGKT
jgi:hypothetical protein